MSELAPSSNVENNEHELSAEALAEASRHLGAEAVESTVQANFAEKISSTDTAKMIDEYKSEHGSVQGLYMDRLLEVGFEPNMVLRKLGNERLEEALSIVNVRYHAKRGTEQWQNMENIEARSIPVSDDEIDALMNAGADPQHIVDALQRVEPQDGVDNPSSSRIAQRLDKLVDAGLPPAILASRLNPSWREAVKDQLTEAEIRWREANRAKLLRS